MEVEIAQLGEFFKVFYFECTLVTDQVDILKKYLSGPLRPVTRIKVLRDSPNIFLFSIVSGYITGEIGITYLDDETILHGAIDLNLGVKIPLVILNLMLYVSTVFGFFAQPLNYGALILQLMAIYLFTFEGPRQLVKLKRDFALKIISQFDYI